MKKAWRVVLIIVLVALVLGAVCAAVGLITGADLPRILSVLDDRYGINLYINWFNELMADVRAVMG